MVAGSSPGTSDMASVWTAAGNAAAARRPPLIAEMCLRTALISPIRAPALSKARDNTRFSSSDIPEAGTVRSAEPPPEMSTKSKSSSPSPAASSSTRKAAAVPVASAPDGRPRRSRLADMRQHGRNGSAPAPGGNRPKPPPPHVPSPPTPSRHRRPEFGREAGKAAREERAASGPLLTALRETVAGVAHDCPRALGWFRSSCDFLRHCDALRSPKCATRSLRAVLGLTRRAFAEDLHGYTKS